MLEVVELKVRIHCKACEKAVRKALCRIKGIYIYMCVCVCIVDFVFYVLNFVCEI